MVGKVGTMYRANEICRESKRQTMSADDVLKAVEELDFPEFAEPLMRCLAGQCADCAHSNPYVNFPFMSTMSRILTHISSILITC